MSTVNERVVLAEVAGILPKFRTLVETYPGSASQLKRVLLKIAEHGLEDNSQALSSYPHEKELFNCLLSIVNAKLVLFHYAMARETKGVVKDETKNCDSNDQQA